MRPEGRQIRRTAGAALVCSALVALSAVLVAGERQDPQAVPTTSEVAVRVMSPFCPGLSLEECPSQQAVQLRARIDRRISAGATNAEIDRWLVEEYGESILGRPPHAAAWVVPAAFVLAGGAAVVLLVTGRKREPAALRTDPSSSDPHVPDADSAYRAQMLQDLSRFAEGTE